MPKITRIRGPVAVLDFFKVGHFPRCEGGRAAHFGLCVAVGRSCVGLSAGRAGSWRGRETAAVPAELCRRRPLLPKDDCDRDEVRDLGPELFSVGISVAAYSGWPRLAQGQEILNKMRALLCSAGGGACYTARQARASNTLRWLREGGGTSFLPIGTK